MDANRVNEILCSLVSDTWRRHYQRTNDAWIHELADAAEEMGLDPVCEMLLFIEIMATQGRIGDPELKAAS